MALRCPPLETMLNFPSVNGGVSILDASKSFPKVSSARAAPSVKRDRSQWRNLDFFCAKRESTRSFNMISTLTEDAGTEEKGAGSLRSDWIRSGFPAAIQLPAARKTEEGEGDKRDFLQGGWVYSNFSAPVQSSAMTRTKDEEDDKQDYYVNMGYAIRTLREELRDVFFKEPTFDIYREDIVFKDPLNTFEGINNYKMIFRVLRMYGRIFFKALWVDILSIWQPVDSVIMIRWTVHGAPRVFWDSHGRFDATSEYKLDRNGKIYEHRVDNVAFNSPPKFRVLAVEELIQTLGCPSTARPTYFEFSPEANTTDEQAWALQVPMNVFCLNFLQAQELARSKKKVTSVWSRPYLYLPTKAKFGASHLGISTGVDMRLSGVGWAGPKRPLQVALGRTWSVTSYLKGANRHHLRRDGWGH